MSADDMTLPAALSLLARVHTADQPEVGFEVRMGAIPEQWDCSGAEYVRAWRLVREAAHMRTEPEHNGRTR